MAIPLTGSKWGQAGSGMPGGVVSWSFAQSAGSFYAFKAYITDTEYQHAIRVAFDAWEAIADIDFVEVADADATKIWLGWNSIDGQGNSVAEAAWSPANGVNTHAEIVFDLADMWKSASFAGGADLLKVAIHEIGHTLGLGHADDPASIMYPYLNGEATISRADISAIQALYGPHRVPVTLIAGSDGTDRLLGTNGADEITGGAGADWIWSRAGDDRIFGGSGDDRISGDLGNDFLSGDDGNDAMDGGDGDDTLLGGAGEDGVQGGGGDDRIDGGAGNDMLDGGVGDDRIDGGDGKDWIMGRSGADHLSGGGGDDVLRGGDGDDELFGGAGRNVLEGEAGNDRLTGGAEIDILNGGEGDDVLYGGRGRDFLIGGSGRDVFQFRSVEDSAVGPLRDRIQDFVAGEDRIDLSAFTFDRPDAAASKGFVFIGTGAFDGIGQLRIAPDHAGRFVIQANLDDDVTTIEFEIDVFGTSGTIGQGDFILA